MLWPCVSSRQGARNSLDMPDPQKADADALERDAGLNSLAAAGFPTQGLEFDRSMALRGLVVDIRLGSLLKVDRFGLVKRAMHGTKMLAPAEIRQIYGRDLVQLAQSNRWVFLNTLFSVSEGCLYMQMIQRMDEGQLNADLGVESYQAMWAAVQKAMFHTHVVSTLKYDIIREPEKYVDLDPDMAAALLDMREAGKQLILITNSDWAYTKSLMSFAYDRCATQQAPIAAIVCVSSDVP